MKVILFKNVIHRGKRYGVGETLDLDEAVAEHFIKRELAQYAAPETADAPAQGEDENAAPETADAQEQKAKTKKGKAAKK